MFFFEIASLIFIPFSFNNPTTNITRTITPIMIKSCISIPRFNTVPFCICSKEKFVIIFGEDEALLITAVITFC